MLSLISLLLIPSIFIGLVLIVSGFYSNNNIKIETNILKQATILEEKKDMIPFVLQKYYSHIINKRSDLIPSILRTS
jgi:hypothetical protein